MKKSFTPLVLLALAGIAGAGTITWSNVGTDWATAGNWSGITTPPTNDLTTDIASFSSTTQVPTWSAARSVGGIEFTAAGTYTMGSGGTNNTLSVGTSGINFGNNAVTLNVNNSGFNQNLVLGGVGTDSGVTTGSGAVTIRATTTASQYLLHIANGRTATFNIGAGGLTMGGNSGSGSTRQAISFGNSTSTLLKTGSGTMFFNSSSTNGAPGLPTGIYDIRQGGIVSDVNSGNFFGTSAITLGDTSGSASSFLEIQRVGTFNSNLTVRSGSAGIKTFRVRFQDQTLTGNLVLNDALTFAVRAAAANTVTVTNNMNVSGSSALNVRAENATGSGLATGITQLGGSNGSYNGSVTVGNSASDGGLTNAILRIGSASALNSSNNVAVNHQGTLRLNGTSVNIGALSGGGVSSFVENAHATTDATLTINSTSPTDTSYSGVVQNGAAAKLNLIKAGTGTQRLTNANTFTGNVSVTGGTLIIQNASGLSTSNNVDAGSSGTFKTAIGNNTLNIGKLSGAGTVTGSLGSNANTVLTITVASGSSTFSGNITQEFSGTFGITKLGAGTQELQGASTHSGPNIVSQGTLLVNNTTGSGTGTGGVSVSSNATLGGSGIISGAVNVTGVLSPGNSAGVLTVNNNVTLNDLGALSVELNGTTVGTGYDRLTMGGSNPTLALNGTNNLLLSLGFTPVVNDLFFIADLAGSNAISGIFEQLNGVTTTLTQDSLFTLGLTQFKISYNGDRLSNTFSTLSGNDLALQVIPEPRAALLGGLGLLALLRRRRSE